MLRGERSSYAVALDVPCRRCAECRARSAAEWRHRVQAELSAFDASWFWTLTLSPQERYAVIAEADAEASSRALPPLAEWGADPALSAWDRLGARQAAFRFTRMIFWRRVIAAYTRGRYTERVQDGEVRQVFRTTSDR